MTPLQWKMRVDPSDAKIAIPLQWKLSSRPPQMENDIVISIDPLNGNSIVAKLR